MRIPAVLAATAFAAAVFPTGAAQAADTADPAAQRSASAHVVDISEATLSWSVSECVFRACASLTQTQSTSAEVTRDDSAWVFTNGSGVYNQVSGESRVSFAGSVTFGNTTMGNYAITLADPVVRVGKAGNGTLRADITVTVGGRVVAQEPRVLMVSLPKAGHAASWSVTPPWDGVGAPGDPAPYVGRQFAQPLIDVLPASLRGWFWSTGETGLNAVKAPAAVVLEQVREYRPTLVVHPSKPLPRKGITSLRVTGVGFDPTVQGGPVQGLYVVFGPNPKRIPDGYSNTEAYTASAYLPAGPDERGRFTTRLEVPGATGVTKTGPTSRPGVATWAAHSHATTAWDAFTRVRLAPR
jgi:hypothetical protein